MRKPAEAGLVLLPDSMRTGDVLALRLEPSKASQAIFFGIWELGAPNAGDMELANVQLAAKRLDGGIVKSFFVEALKPLFEVLEFCRRQAMFLSAELGEHLPNHAPKHLVVRTDMEDGHRAADAPEFKLLLVPVKVHEILSIPRMGWLKKGLPRWLLWCGLHQKKHLIGYGQMRARRLRLHRTKRTLRWPTRITRMGSRTGLSRLLGLISF
jgi:hypothetical protein